jgi:hypothetical protein
MGLVEILILSLGVLGVNAIFKGCQGFTCGIPCNKRIITGTSAKVIGTFCFVLGAGCIGFTVAYFLGLSHLF